MVEFVRVFYVVYCQHWCIPTASCRSLQDNVLTFHIAQVSEGALCRKAYASNSGVYSLLPEDNIVLICLAPSDYTVQV